jgi:phosphotransferase system IIA component
LFYFFLKVLRPRISEKLEIFYTIGLDTIGMRAQRFSQFAKKGRELYLP